MGGCCSGPANVLVEFEYLAVDGETCERCGDSRGAVRDAVARAREALPSYLALDLVERELSSDRLADSNRVLVNGRPAEEWLGGSSFESDCASCADLTGQPACCRAIEVGGMRSESVSAAVVLDAIMAAAGLAPVGVPGDECCATAGGASAASGRDACCGSGAAKATPLPVVLVTGPGCG